MSKSWPMGLYGKADIEHQIGLVTKVFLCKNVSWILFVYLAFLAFFGFSLVTMGNWDGAGVLQLILGLTTALFLFLAWRYRRKRKYFALCEEGCAYSEALSLPATVLPWRDVTHIKIDEDASLKTEKNHFLGMELSSTLHHVQNRFVEIQSNSGSIRFKLSEFGKPKKLLDAILDATSDKAIELDHDRKESKELLAAKDAGKEADFGKRKLTALGVVVVVIIIILKILFFVLKR